MRTYQTHVNDELLSPRRQRPDSADISWRSSLHANVNFDLDEIRQYLRRFDLVVDPLVEDLLDIAVAVYVHDRIYKRDPRELSRISRISVPVRNPDIWNSNNSILLDTLSFLMRDQIEVTFSSLHAQRTGGSFSLKADRPVCLFSGGADSFAGAVTLLEQGRDPILVSHSPGNIRGVQRTLAEALEQYYPDRTIDFFPVRVSLTSELTEDKELTQLKQESTQWARSFLYLSLASAFAITMGTSNLQVFENGPIALNVPIAESRNNTRTANPIFLDLYRRMISEVFGTNIEIQNQFVTRTKGEILSTIADKPIVKMLRGTHSCWRQGEALNFYASRNGRSSTGRTHCGTCYPCVIRKAALTKSRLATCDDDLYVFDIAVDYPRLDDVAMTTIDDFFDFVGTVDGKSGREILRRYSTLSTEMPGIAISQAVDVYRRFAAEIKGYFESCGSSVRRALSDFLT